MDAVPPRDDAFVGSAPVEEHGTEITRTGRGRLGAAATVATLAVGALLLADGGSGTDLPGPTSSVPEPVTVPADGPPVVGIGRSGDGPVVAIDGDTLADVRPRDAFAVARAAVATEEMIAVVDAGGGLVAGGPDGRFRTERCCADTVEPSYRPGHVWAVEGDRARLVELGAGPTRQELDLGDQAVLGPGPGGLVTVDAQGAAAWRRPGVPARPVPVRAGRRAVSAGGDVVAYVVASPAAVEVRRVTDGILVRSFPLDRPAPDGVTARLSPFGDAIAIGRDGSSTVHAVADGTVLGRLPTTEGLVPVGGGRFATIVDGAVVTSDGQRFAAGERPDLVATRAG